MSKLQKILYVEDEADIRNIAQIALEDLGGFTVKFCCNAQEALNEAEAFAPDLLLLDVMMPGMDGLSLLKELRQKVSLAETPVIFMTAKVQPSEIEHYRSFGALDVIVKPFDPMTLAETIKNIWKDNQ